MANTEFTACLNLIKLLHNQLTKQVGFSLLLSTVLGLSLPKSD